MKTPIDIRGTHFDRPRTCESAFAVGLYGVFDLPDASCKPSFRAPTSTSCTGGKRTYRAYLLNTPEKELGRAEQLCKATQVTIDGKQVSPSRCFSDGTGWQGEFVVEDKACTGPDPEPKACRQGVVSVVQVAVQNQTRHELALWTQDLTKSAVPTMIKHLSPDERYLLAGDKMPESGHDFAFTLLDVTAVQEHNKHLAEIGSSTAPYGIDSTGPDGAIYVYNFLAMDPLPLVACKQSEIGYSQETGQYYLVGAARGEVPAPPVKKTGLVMRRPH